MSLKSPVGEYAKSERETFDYFKNRIRNAKPPFFGTYYFYSTHFPYYDNGPKYQLKTDTTSALNRYLNALNMADHLIEELFQELKSMGELEKTIVVILGDHGEGFGKTPQQRLHNHHHSNEVQQTPMVIWQPHLFLSQKIETATSHVDVAPTILNAIKPHFDLQLFQGEAIQRSKNQNRKYIFVINSDDKLTTISQQNQKMIMNFTTDFCGFYNLKTDPKEEKIQECAQGSEQFKAMLSYRKYQIQLLNNLHFKGK